MLYLMEPTLKKKSLKLSLEVMFKKFNFSKNRSCNEITNNITILLTQQLPSCAKFIYTLYLRLVTIKITRI